MLKSIKKICVMSILIMGLSIISVSAVYVTCQNKVTTGKGYYDADCYGTTLRFHGYYEDSSEQYTVMNYVGTNEEPYRISDGCSAGNRNADGTWNVGRPYNGYAHIHTYTVNRN